MPHLLLLGAALLAPPAHADDAAGPDPVAALRLPGQSLELRKLGVPEHDLDTALAAARDQGVGAGDAADALEATATAVQEHGPVDNFGAFVQARLQEGLRGRDLARAIQQEHERNGKGKGHKGSQPDPDKKPDDAGQGQGQGHGKGNMPAEAGQAEGGKPAHAGGKGGKGGKSDKAGGNR